MKLVKGLLLVTLTLPAMVCAMEKGDLEAVFGTQQDAIVGMVSSGAGPDLSSTTEPESPLPAASRLLGWITVTDSSAEDPGALPGVETASLVGGEIGKPLFIIANLPQAIINILIGEEDIVIALNELKGTHPVLSEAIDLVVQAIEDSARAVAAEVEAILPLTRALSIQPEDTVRHVTAPPATTDSNTIIFSEE